jgi:hypothetical protein
VSDTSPVVAALVRERWLALSGAERLALAADMYDTARALVLASLPEELSAAERQARLCERFYGAELARRYRVAVETATRTNREDVPL